MKQLCKRAPRIPPAVLWLAAIGVVFGVSFAVVSVVGEAFGLREPLLNRAFMAVVLPFVLLDAIHRVADGRSPFGGGGRGGYGGGGSGGDCGSGGGGGDCGGGSASGT